MVVEWRYHSRHAGNPRRRPTHRLAGTVPRNGSHDRYPAGCAWYDGCWATSLLVHAPAALRECQDRGLHAQTGTPRARPSPRNGGHQPKDWRAPTQGLAGVTFQHCRRPQVLPRLRRMRVRGGTWKFYFDLGAWYVCIERRWLVVSRHLVFSRFSPQGGLATPTAMCSSCFG